MELSAGKMADLGLETYEVYGPKALDQAVDRAIKRFHGLAERAQELRPYCDLIAKHMTRRIWCRPKPGHATGFSSAAYPAVPGVVFLTPLVFVHVPPNVQFMEISNYAVFENLVHESIHQELGERLPYLEQWRNPGTVEIPWRDSRWTIPHAIHAYTVYRHVAELRRICACAGVLSGGEAAALGFAAPEVAEILSHLARGLVRGANPAGPIASNGPY